MITLPISSKANRICALLTALLYVFFTTFGAVAHTHSTIDLSQKSPTAARSAKSGGQTGHACLIAGRTDCAACEWQALSVTQPAVAQPPCEAALLPIAPSVSDFSLYTVCLARFASRGPPAAV